MSSYDSSHLRATLLSVLNAHPADAHAGLEDVTNNQELFEELMTAKPHLLRLFDFGPRSAAEKQEVESGEYFGSFVRNYSQRHR